jgi:hypothetical protein
MKRIAAIAAVVLALLAVPATAMASTTWGGPQPPRHHPHPGPPGNCQVWSGSYGGYCCPAGTGWGNGWGGGQFQDCQQQALTFNLAAYSSRATEVSGPQLSVGETVLYQNEFYTVASVWHRHFTLDQGGSLYTNGAYPIWDGSASVLTGPWIFQNN